MSVTLRYLYITYALIKSWFTVCLTGDDGNLAKLEHCNFTENTGFGSQLDFGAAVALSFLTVFRQRVISPRHEITSWYIIIIK